MGGRGTKPGGGAAARKLGAAPVASSANLTSVAWLGASGVNRSVAAAGFGLRSRFGDVSSAMR